MASSATAIAVAALIHKPPAGLRWTLQHHVPSRFCCCSAAATSSSSAAAVRVLERLPAWDGLRMQRVPGAMTLSLGRQGHEKRGRNHGKGAYASLFGVGAPEALVIGVVALLVFGPKGLAEVARNLGKTLRAFQPTIRELQDVSREFKSTLEREIGLDEITSTNYKPTGYTQGVTDPNGRSVNSSYSSEDLLKVTQEQLAASAAADKPEATSPLQESPKAAEPAAPSTASEAPSESAGGSAAAPGIPNRS